MKIAVTGATGFLGSHLIFHLAAAGYEVRALVRTSSHASCHTTTSSLKFVEDFVIPGSDPGSSDWMPDQVRHDKQETPHEFTRRHAAPAVVFSVNFNSTDSIAQAFQGCDVVIHLLGLINGSEEMLKESNVDITDRILQACRAAKIPKILHMSSVAAVMGHGPYGRSKAEGEALVRNSGIPSTIFQPAYIYGQGDLQLTKRMTNVLRYSPIIPVLGGGTFKIQPVYVGDVCQAIMTTLRRDIVNETFILAGPEQVPLKDMLRLMAGAMKIRRLFLPVPLKPMQTLCGFLLKLFPNTRLPLKQVLELDKHQAFDISHARKILGFNPIPFHEGVSKIYESFPCAA